MANQTRRHHFFLLLLLLVAVLGAVGCKRNAPAVKERIAFWENTLQTEVPVGSSKNQILRWGDERHVPFIYIPEKRWFYAIVEKLPEPGIPFPCSEWNITVQITLDSTDHSIANHVGMVGSCV